MLLFNDKLKIEKTFVNEINFIKNKNNLPVLFFVLQMVFFTSTDPCV